MNKNNNPWSIKQIFNDVFIQTGVILFPLVFLIIFIFGVIWEKYSTYIINLLTIAVTACIWTFQLVTNVKFLIMLASIYLLIKLTALINSLISISGSLKELKHEISYISKKYKSDLTL